MVDKENAILEAINKDYTILYPGEDYEVSVSDIVEYTKKKMIDKAWNWILDNYSGAWNNTIFQDDFCKTMEE